MKIVPMSVELIDYMGTDLSVVNAARVSFNKESDFDYDYGHDGRTNERLIEKDVKLISYLAKHNHFTPFTHCSTTFRIKVPIFVARQLHKHQVGFTVNEVSRRYVSDEPEFFFPEEWRGKPINAKQGSNGIIQDIIMQEQFKRCILRSYYQYDSMIKLGIAPEQARMVLPLNTMTEFWMTGSLYGWARLCKLRLDSHAQKEIRDIASLLSLEMQKLYPVSWEVLLQN